MKYTPHILKENVNVSKTHPLVELFWLTGGLILMVGIVFVALGLATDFAVSKTPLSVENWLGERALIKHPAKTNPELTQQLDKLLSTLPESSPLHHYQFKAYLSESKLVNAMALPGGKIVVFSGLIENVESENELAMILYHELGHFIHRDHLRGLGRGLGVVVATTLLFGVDSAAGDLVSNTFLSFHADYSQDQESAADVFGLAMLNEHYGHVGGSTDFFMRLAKKSGSHIPYLLASHPHPQDRIDKLQTIIKENGYSIEATLPLDLANEK